MNHKLLSFSAIYVVVILEQIMKKRLLGIFALVLLLSSVSFADPLSSLIKIGSSGMTTQMSCGSRGC
jgi:hypothetical protein